MILAATLIAVALSIHPLQGPQEEGVSKSSNTQNTATPKHANTSQEPSHPLGAQIVGQPSTERSKSSTEHDASDVNVQRNIEIFTGVLAGVGVLQLVVMFLTWRVYHRQAKIMRHQAHEMKRQRAYMRLQWNAMKEQIKLTEKQFSISHRPWCAFAESPKAESALRFDNEGGCLKVSYTIRNGSNTSPAIGINTVLQFVISLDEAPNHQDLRKALEQLAPPDFIKTITESWGVFLLSEAIMSFPPTPVRVYKESLKTVQGKKITLVLIACVAYRDEFGTTIHKTGAAYRFVTSRGERSYQPTGAMNGRFEILGVGYAD